jgi:phenylpropionate dioxygenase-like ring-hydroxylating dioxygenase large terminal subunit
VAGSAYADVRIHALERDRLFRDAWTVAGHESQLAHPGEFLTIDTALERVLLVRGASGQVHALRNSCPAYPHRLVAPAGGRFESGIECRVHGLEFSLDGRCQGTTGSPLCALDLSSSGGLLLVRCADPAHGAAERAGWVEDALPHGLAALTAPLEAAVAADWKVLVEQWLAATRGREPRPSGRPWPAPLALAWEVPVLAAADWSARRYRNLVGCSVDRTWRRLFIAPNQLIEIRPDGLSVLQAVPVAPGRSLLRRLDYSAPGPPQAARGALYLARRLGGQARRAALELAESIQRGLADFAYAAPAGDVPEAVAWFHDLVAAAVPALARHPPASDN